MAVRDRSQSVEALPGEWETKSAEALLAWALGEFHPRIALAASFGAEDVVLIDMLVKLDPRARVFTLDTGRLPAETYSLMETIRARYGLAIEVYFPQADAVEAMVREHGVNLFYTSIDSRKLCCGVRKVEPLSRALRGLDAWITGLRREQAVTRAQVRKVGVRSEERRVGKECRSRWSPYH